VSQPNILWLVADHFAFKHHVDLYPELKLKTYNQLGAEGIVFDQAYSVCPLCQPARTSMLTGIYSHRHGVLINDEASNRGFRLAPEQRLISSYVKDAGYRNVYFGKWHCGYDKIARDYDFEGWSLPGYGRPYQTEQYADYLADNGLSMPQVTVDWDIQDPKTVGQSYMPFGPWVAAGTLSGPIEAHESFFVADAACRWMDENAHQSQPFFMRVDVWGPHHPYHSAGGFRDSIDPKALDKYPSFEQPLDAMPRSFDVAWEKWHEIAGTDHWEWWQQGLARCFEQIMVVDQALGQVISTLDNLGLKDDSLVIYVADHGDLIASHGGLINKDALMFEETMRVPLALRWSRRFVGGAVSEALVSNMDLAATVLDAVQPPSWPEVLDCESLLPLCEDPTAPGRDVLMSEDHGELKVEFFQRMIRWQDYKYVAHLDHQDELHDLARDPYELNNLASDPESIAVLKQMRELTREQMELSADESADANRLKSQLEAC